MLQFEKGGTELYVWTTFRTKIKPSCLLCKAQWPTRPASGVACTTLSSSPGPGGFLSVTQQHAPPHRAAPGERKWPPSPWSPSPSHPPLFPSPPGAAAPPSPSPLPRLVPRLLPPPPPWHPSLPVANARPASPSPPFACAYHAVRACVACFSMRL